MLSLLGYTCIGASIALGSYPAFESVFLKRRYHERKLKENLQQAFVNGEMYKKKGDEKIYPHILRVESKIERITFIFSIPKGLSPEKINESFFVFKQHFGMFISIDVNEKRGILKVYPKGLPNKFKYNYEEIKECIPGLKIPIITGQCLEGNLYAFDLVINPHIIIAGETGGGKSSAIRSILTTLIKTKQPSELKLILGDLKRSEFHLFKEIKHVEGVYHSANELLPELKKIKREMTKRGDLLDKEGVNSIDELKVKLPYIVICIDEVRLLKKEKDVMEIIEEISSIGRSLGIFIILSMQRPDSKLLEGALKVNCTVRMGFKTADATNSKIIGTPGAEKTNIPGRMILKINSDLLEIQSPWLHNDIAKKLLKPYKTDKPPIKETEICDKYSKVREMLQHEKA